MKKLNSLRAHLTTALPELAREPDALALYAADGRIAARLGSTLGFEYRYNATLFLLNFRDDPAQLFLPLLTWIDANQAELLLNHQTGVESIAFSVDVIDQQTVDIEIKLPLTEAVDVTLDDNGETTITVRDEQPMDDLLPMTPAITLLRQIYAPGDGSELLAGYPEP